MLKEIASEHFRVSSHSPIVEGGEHKVYIAEINTYGQNNTIYCNRSELKELIQLLRLADGEFGG